MSINISGTVYNTNINKQSNIGILNRYSNYKMENISERYSDREVQKSNNQLEISENGLRALKMSHISKNVKDISSVSTQNIFDKFQSTLSSESISERFPSESGVKTDSFDRYVNKMALAYQTMKKEIEEKYNDSNRTQEYYIADDGSIQELTQENELAMLNRAYQKQSEFMATSTGIWSELQDFKVNTVYGSKKEAITSNEKTDKVIKGDKNKIANQSYKAFISAISSGNQRLLQHEDESLNHFKLKLDISDTERFRLNQIWDYYANIKN